MKITTLHQFQNMRFHQKFLIIWLLYYILRIIKGNELGMYVNRIQTNISVNISYCTIVPDNCPRAECRKHIFKSHRLHCLSSNSSNSTNKKYYHEKNQKGCFYYNKLNTTHLSNITDNKVTLKPEHTVDYFRGEYRNESEIAVWRFNMERITDINVEGVQNDDEMYSSLLISNETTSCTLLLIEYDQELAFWPTHLQGIVVTNTSSIYNNFSSKFSSQNNCRMEIFEKPQRISNELTKLNNTISLFKIPSNFYQKNLYIFIYLSLISFVVIVLYTVINLVSCLINCGNQATNWRYKFMIQGYFNQYLYNKLQEMEMEVNKSKPNEEVEDEFYVTENCLYQKVQDV